MSRTFYNRKFFSKSRHPPLPPFLPHPLFIIQPHSNSVIHLHPSPSTIHRPPFTLNPTVLLKKLVFNTNEGLFLLSALMCFTISQTSIFYLKLWTVCIFYLQVRLFCPVATTVTIQLSNPSSLSLSPTSLGLH